MRYPRLFVPGGTYFFTVVTYQRCKGGATLRPYGNLLRKVGHNVGWDEQPEK